MSSSLPRIPHFNSLRLLAAHEFYGMSSSEALLLLITILFRSSGWHAHSTSLWIFWHLFCFIRLFMFAKKNRFVQLVRPFLWISKSFTQLTASQDFSWMRARFNLEVWGRRRVRSTRLLWAQHSATVRNRWQPLASVCDEVAIALPMAMSAKLVTFESFKRA